MRIYGIKGSLLLWIKDFLSERTQQVVLNGLASNTFIVSSGVPQGLVMGPLGLLFLVYINDIPEQVECNISIFANDTKIYTAVKSIADSQRLQTDLNSLARWADDCLLRFNANKCKCMSFGSTTTTLYNLTDANNQHNLSITDCKKDLGIWLSSTLRPSVQCQKAYSKAMQSLATIK